MVKKIFYAHARDEKPFVRISSLKQGNYNEVNYFSMRSFIRFTDIGKLVWENLKNMGYDPVINLVKTSMIEEDKAWTVFMYCQGLGILMKSQRYNHFGIYPKPFYLTLELEGPEMTIKGFILKLVKDMDYKPWGDLDWEALNKKTDLDKKDAIHTWSECLVRGAAKVSVDTPVQKKKDELDNILIPDVAPSQEPPKRRRRRRVA